MTLYLYMEISRCVLVLAHLLRRKRERLFIPDDSWRLEPRGLDHKGPGALSRAKVRRQESRRSGAASLRWFRAARRAGAAVVMAGVEVLPVTAGRVITCRRAAFIGFTT